MNKIVAVCASLLSLMPAMVAANCMDTDNGLWKKDQKAVYDKLAPLLSCPASVGKNEGRLNDQIPCNYFLAKSISIVYGVNDFIPSDKEKYWPVANEIVDTMNKGGAWHTIGPANVQANLDTAASKANAGHAVVAGAMGNPGHVAVVLPGAQFESTTWKDSGKRNLTVPNSASFFLDNVSKAYVLCRLSAAWKGDEAAGVTLFYRDKP